MEVTDASMEPALRPGDRLLVEPADRLRAGEIIVVHDPESPGRFLIKRIAAVGGEAVFVTRDGAVAALTHDLPPPEDSIERLEVPAGRLFLLSDHPVGARDSRRFGTIPASAVIGRAWYRYAPSEREGPI